jgi:dihydroorotate dehydrogenase (NAD+) catalytic subunit
MIKLSNNHSFEFVAASGALAFDGRGWPWEWPLRWAGMLDPTLFTIVVKTLTRQPRKGNLRWTQPWSVIKHLGTSGIANAIGLTNDGIDWWLREVSPAIPSDYKIIVSIEADDLKEAVDMVQMLEGQTILGIELNLSCPNTGAAGGRTTEKILKICQAANKTTAFPLIAKLSYAHDYLEVAKGLEDLKNIEALAINSIPWSLVYPDKKSPLAKFGGGGVSGKVAQPFTWKMVRELSKAVKIPVIGPSVWAFSDIQKIFDQGAQAVSFGSIFVSSPWKPTLLVKKWQYLSSNISKGRYSPITKR